MNQSQEMTSEEKSNVSEDVNESLGLNSSQELQEEPSDQNDLPEFAKKKLGMQEKRHKKELRRMQQQIDEMRNHLSSKTESQSSPQPQVDNVNFDSGNMNENIYAAVTKALQIQKEQEHRAKEAEKMQHVHKQYQNLKDQLDNGSSKYDDFDDVVNSDDAPYTEAMRDAALLIGNPSETLYHLGKDRDKLKKLSELHPLEQAKEVVRMSIALMSGNGKKESSDNFKPLGQIKNNPVNTTHVNENTSVSDLRSRMKSGNKHWS